MTRTGGSRRTVLAGLIGGAALAGTAGCDLFGDHEPKTSAVPNPLAPVLAGTLALVDTYTATIAAQPGLATTLSPLLDEHRAHVRALRAAMGLPEPSGSGSAPRASATPSTSVPEDPAAAQAGVRGAESAARDAAVKDCLSAQPAYASLLGSIAASRACHLEVLG